MFIVKKHLCFLMLCSLIFLLFLPGRALPAFAAPAPAGASLKTSAFATRLRERTQSERHCCSVGWRRPVHRFWNKRFQENQQDHQGTSNSGNTIEVEGDNQGNTGNQGLNFGSVLDHTLNSGNQIINRRAYSQRNFQHLSGESDSYNHLFIRGRNQLNAGNSGVNWGDVEDANRNDGNQIIN